MRTQIIGGSKLTGIIKDGDQASIHGIPSPFSLRNIGHAGNGFKFRQDEPRSYFSNYGVGLPDRRVHIRHGLLQQRHRTNLTFDLHELFNFRVTHGTCLVVEVHRS